MKSATVPFPLPVVIVIVSVVANPTRTNSGTRSAPCSQPMSCAKVRRESAVLKCLTVFFFQFLLYVACSLISLVWNVVSLQLNLTHFDLTDTV